MSVSIDSTTYDKARRYPSGHGYSPRPTVPQAILVHATHGRRGSSFDAEATYLLTSPNVSAHYLVGKAGQVVQFLDPRLWAAWHSGDCAPNLFENTTSIGIELHAATTDAITPAQRDALTVIVQRLMRQFAIPRERIARHGTVAVPAGRKSDPATWPEAAFAAWRATLTPDAITPDAALLAPPRCSLEQARRLFAARGPWGEYTEDEVCAVILPAYFNVCPSLDLDPCLVVAQMAHETEWLRSFWAQRPQRNPAGIGVDGTRQDEKPLNAHGWRFNTQRQKWEKGLSFGGWLSDSIPAHVGRLLAWALPPGTGTPQQKAMINRALGYRPLPLEARASAPTLRPLGKAHNRSGYGWASPGDRYGEAIAAIMNEMRAL